MPKFPSIPSSPNFFQLQSEVLKYREENKIFEKSISNREDAENFTIFDWPPFKNWTPHYGHVLQSTIKDTIPRFWTMKGKKVPRARWRDCHGIYIEQKVQKSLGLKTNQEIENFGVENFIKECYRFTNLANDDRNWTVPNIGRRVDMNNAYETMSNDYMESVWHVFKTIYDQNKIYKGKRVSMYSTKLNTAVGNFEVQADNSYAEINDPAITVKFKVDSFDNISDVYILARTTTPWTIPANIALVVNSEMDYVLIGDLEKSEKYILAKDLLSKYYKEESKYEIIKEYKWSELIWISYNPPFDYYNADRLSEGGKSENTSAINNSHKVYAADYVTATDGTWIVHTAPEFGEEDFATGKRENLYQTNALNEEWRYTAEIYDMKWLYYRKDSDTEAAGESNANDEVMRRLTTQWLLFRKESITHTVPLCPRTQTPLIYKTQDSWFVDIDSIKPQLLAQNENINRVPNSVKYSRFAKSIETAPDRCISRTKYWATPMPVWIAKDAEWNTVDTKVMWSREDIYNLDQTGSKAIMKINLIRHWETNFNISRTCDSMGEAILSEKWEQQALELANKIEKSDSNIYFVSPLPRTWKTIKPHFDKILSSDDISKIDSKYFEIVNNYQSLRKSWEILNLLKENDSNKLNFDLWNNIYIDYRLAEHISPNFQWKEYILNRKQTRSYDPIFETWEGVMDIYDRSKMFMNYVLWIFNNKNIYIVSHQEPLMHFAKIMSDYDYDNDTERRWIRAKIQNAKIVSYYYNTQTGKEFDFHRPYIDSIWGQDWENRYSRTPEVLDPWMDSGSMPFAQLHYPFENADAFKDWFPADFIGEGAGQIRCRFQMMHNVSTLMTGKNAYKNVVVTGTVQWNDWRKMSKSFGNYPDIRPTIEKYGADSIRMMLLGSPLMAGGDLAFSEEWLKEVLRKINLPLRNSYSFFTTYANIDNFSPTKNNIKDFEWFEFGNDLDEWIISKLAILIDTVNTSMIAYDIQSAIKPIYIFMEDLTNRYIRRNRRRFRKSENDSDKMTGYDVLYVVLVELCKVMSPFMPFLPEYIYRNLTWNESVHLTDWTE